MGLRHAMAVLAEQWDDIRERLPDAEFAELTALADDFTHEGDRGASEELAESIADLLHARLPSDHAFQRALREREDRLAPDPVRRAADLDRWFRLAEPLRAHLGDPAPTVAEALRALRERLLAAPALSAAELRARGGDTDDPDLIRLVEADGTGRWPAFQFGGDGTPLPVVKEVNRLLEASDDPVGAADWWLGGNGRLQDAPVRLLGRVPDEVLLQTVRDAPEEA